MPPPPFCLNPSWAPRIAPRSLWCAQDRPKIPQGRAKTLQDRPKIARRGPPDRFPTPQDRPKKAQERSKSDQERSWNHLGAILGHFGAILESNMCVFPYAFFNTFCKFVFSPQKRFRRHLGVQFAPTWVAKSAPRAAKRPSRGAQERPRAPQD